MNWFQHKYRSVGLLAVALFVVTGTYNAVVINSESYLASSDMKFVKRLDEIYGVTVSQRQVANTQSWQKLTPAPVAQPQLRPHIEQVVSTIESAPEQMKEDIVPEAAVQEELSLTLVEVLNSKKWQNGLSNTQFNGSLTTNAGVIESLSVSLPNDEGISVSFSEMTGNVFEYDLNGELYSGMMYQVDKNSYMITLSNGPLEGTRLRFSADTPAEEREDTQVQTAENYGNDTDSYELARQAEENLAESQANYQDQLAQNNDIQAPEMIPSYDQEMQQQAMQMQQDQTQEVSQN